MRELNFSNSWGKLSAFVSTIYSVKSSPEATRKCVPDMESSNLPITPSLRYHIRLFAWLNLAVEIIFLGPTRAFLVPQGTNIPSFPTLHGTFCHIQAYQPKASSFHWAALIYQILLKKNSKIWCVPNEDQFSYHT